MHQTTMKRSMFVLTAIMLSFSVFAHPGKTDANGGHYSRANGIYHYHHGYEGHYHTDGLCPYDFDDKTDHSNHGGSGGSNAIGAPYVPKPSNNASGSTVSINYDKIRRDTETKEQTEESPLRQKLSEAANEALDRRTNTVDETKEPYDKDDNYSSDNSIINDNSSETKVTVWTVLTAIGCAALALYSLWYVVAFAIYLAKEDLGCFIFLAAPFVICSLILLFTYHFKVTLYITIAVSLIAILVVFCLKRYNNEKENIKKAKSAVEKLDYLLESIARIPKELSTLKSTVPSIYEIGKDGLPKDKTSAGWGHSFTVYKTQNGKKLHPQYGCCYATHKKHIYNYYPRLKTEPLLCCRCGYGYKVPDLEWYKDILKRNRLNAEYKNNKEQITESYFQMRKYHNLCNNRFSKIYIIFSKRAKKDLNELNTEYKKVLTEYNKIYR